MADFIGKKDVQAGKYFSLDETILYLQQADTVADLMGTKISVLFSVSGMCYSLSAKQRYLIHISGLSNRSEQSHYVLDHACMVGNF